MRRLIAVDLFCGAGGFSLGCIQAGLDVVLGLDNNPGALTTYWLNLARPSARWIGDLPSPRFRRDWGWVGDRPPFYGEVDPRGLSAWVRGGGTEREYREAQRRAERSTRKWRTVRAVICRDAREVFGWDILDAIGRSDVDVVIGAPPCGSFSRVGKRRVGDPRDDLVFEFVRIVQELRPKAWVMENVPDLATKRLPSGVKVIDVLQRLGTEPYVGADARLLVQSGA